MTFIPKQTVGFGNVSSPDRKLTLGGSEGTGITTRGPEFCCTGKLMLWGTLIPTFLDANGKPIPPPPTYDDLLGSKVNWGNLFGSGYVIETIGPLYAYMNSDIWNPDNYPGAVKMKYDFNGWMTKRTVCETVPCNNPYPFDAGGGHVGFTQTCEEKVDRDNNNRSRPHVGGFFWSFEENYKFGCCDEPGTSEMNSSEVHLEGTVDAYPNPSGLDQSVPSNTDTNIEDRVTEDILSKARRSEPDHPECKSAIGWY